MNAPQWLSIICPLTSCQLEPLTTSSDQLVWHAALTFMKWSPTPNVLPPTRKERYGKTTIIGEDGSWSVVEIELTRRLREAGWQAGWVDTFGGAPKAWAEWLVNPSSLPSALGHFISEIDRVTGRKGGKPDLVAWQGDSLAKAVFLECKGPGDKIHQKQEEWLNAALRAGMSCEQFAVAKWSMA